MRFVFFATLVTLSSLSAQESAVDTSHAAFISIACEHAGLPVLIDGVEAGKTPLRFHPVMPGEHEIAVRRNSSPSWLDTDWVKQVTLASGDTLELEATFLRGYVIHTTPFGAQVWIDDQFVGTTPAVLRLPETSTTEVRIFLEGYRPASFTIASTPAPPAKRQFEIVLESETLLATSSVRQAEEEGDPRKKYRKLMYLGAGLSLASGLAATFFKHESDAAYEQYLHIGDLQERQQYYDRAEKYGQYADISFVIFQAGLGLAFYGFLKGY